MTIWKTEVNFSSSKMHEKNISSVQSKSGFWSSPGILKWKIWSLRKLASLVSVVKIIFCCCIIAFTICIQSGTVTKEGWYRIISEYQKVLIGIRGVTSLLISKCHMASCNADTFLERYTSSSFIKIVLSIIHIIYSPHWE